MENRNRLSSWLVYDPESGPSRPGFRPSNLYVLEFTEDGKPTFTSFTSVSGG